MWQGPKNDTAFTPSSLSSMKNFCWLIAVGASDVANTPLLNHSGEVSVTFDILPSGLLL